MLPARATASACVATHTAHCALATIAAAVAANLTADFTATINAAITTNAADHYLRLHLQRDEPRLVGRRR